MCCPFITTKELRHSRHPRTDDKSIMLLGISGQWCIIIFCCSSLFLIRLPSVIRRAYCSILPDDAPLVLPVSWQCIYQ